ncbi:MAG: tagaturonate reductase [Bacteroidia bacterium]|nr:tagaturonate reductase [Bacteroidia bacterium]
MTHLSRTSHPRPSRPEIIVQFGGGNFMRAFADWAIQEMNEMLDFGAGVLVVKPTERAGRDLITEQDGLFTLYLTGIVNGQPLRTHQVVDCIQRQINPYEAFEEYLQAAHHPDLSVILSNTTESGIVYDPACRFEDAPQESFPGKLTRLLWERFDHVGGNLDKGVVVIPCELIERNGEALKAHVLRHATDWELPGAFHTWVNQACEFCNTLVDRIVPGYPKDREEEICAELGYQDELIVEGELFHLWVIEGSEKAKQTFPAHKAGLNVVFTDDLDAYRERKVRVLNGAHTSMVPVGYLAGVKTVREAVEDPEIGAFIQEYLFEEVVPLLSGDTAELQSYATDILNRFLNPFLQHFLSSIALNSLSKFETRVLPTLTRFYEVRQEIAPRAAFAMAALIQFYEGSFEGKTTPVQDDPARVAWLQDLWKQVNKEEIPLEELVDKVLANGEIWGRDLRNINGLVFVVTTYLEGIHKNGIRATLTLLPGGSRR